MGLDLSGQHLKNLPESIGNLKKLQILDLNENELSYLPKSIKNLEKLRGLNLSNNNFEKLPKLIGSFEWLIVLRLYDNKLKSLPESIVNLKLKHLDIRKNPITALPKSIKQWIKDLKDKGCKIQMENS